MKTRKMVNLTIQLIIMRKKTSLTIVERAIIAVPGFEGVAKKLGQQVELRG